LKTFVAPVLLAGALAGVTPIGAAASTSWTEVPIPSAGSSDNSLEGVAALSPTNAWAVGTYRAGSGATQDSLILHWNGSHWTKKSSPNPGGTGRTMLFGVAATSSTDVWAVGYYHHNGSRFHTLVLHWNGTSWTHMSSPNPGTTNNLLTGVAAISSHNAWAVGYHYTGTGGFSTLILHWDGVSWKRVTSPSPGDSTFYNILNGVAAVSSTNVWAVGAHNEGTAYTTLVLHWKGTSWKRVPSPNPGSASPTFDNYLSGVSATSSTNVWAVGFYEDGTATQALVLRWKGTSWAQTSTPHTGPSSDGNFLNGVSATSSTNAWAVGYYFNGTVKRTLILHWNGTSWTHQTSPNPGGSSLDNVLQGVAATSSTDAWAVGSYVDIANQNIALRCC
jgi:hypothetical protein